MSSRSGSRAASTHAKTPHPAKPSGPPQTPPPKPAERTPVLPAWLSQPAPKWVIAVLFLLGAVFLMSLFTTESSDSDAWWHLKTGQYIALQHKLPVPDPFSWTTYLGRPSYPGEETTRHFNLTHEWLAQLMMYAAFAAGKFRGLILLRAAWLTAFCGLIGAVAWKRTGSSYAALAAAVGATFVMNLFVADRPQIFTYAFLVLLILILESRRFLWLLPPLFLVWANTHAGFVMGWVIMGAYCAESLFFRLLGKPAADERRLWILSVAAILVSGLNPNHFNVIAVLGYYRQSPLQSSIWEWQRPKYWEISPFNVLMYTSVLVLLLNWRKTRPVDWMLLGVFSVSGLMAMRNIFLVGFWGPILLASYLPKRGGKSPAPLWVVTAAFVGIILWYVSQVLSMVVVVSLAAIIYLAATRKFPILAAALTAFLIVWSIAFQIVSKNGFQFRGADWKYPSAACDFLLQHNIRGRMLNTYAQGGYLMWRLWPQLQVFLDGRALNEQVYRDLSRILGNADTAGGKSADQLLKEYAVDLIVVDGFESVSGAPNYLPAALADPSQKEWKLVYQDVHDVIYMRNPPPDVPVLQSLNALYAMEQQCSFYVDHGQPLCAHGLMDVFGRIGARDQYEKWRQVYEAHPGAANFFEVRPK